MKLMVSPEARVKNKERIKEEYSSLKGDLKSEYERYKSNRSREAASDLESSYYIPAVDDAFLHMKAKIGSPPNDELFSSAHDVSDYMSYWKIT